MSTGAARTIGKRRPKGDGTLYKQPNGSWQGKVTIDGRRISFYAPTQQGVRNKMRDALAAADRGEYLAGAAGKERLETYLRTWLETVATPKLKRSTLKTYRGYIENHLIPRLGQRRLNRLGPDHIDAALAAMASDGLRPASIRQVRAILRSALGHAEKRGIVARNVARLSEPPRVSRPELVTLGIEDARALVTAAAGERLGPLWILLLDTGLRRGEALGLRWRDIDLEQNALRVVQARVSVGEGFDEPKSRESRRSVVFSDVTAEALLAWRAAQEKEREGLADWTADDLVFTTPRGAGLSPDAASKTFRRFVETHALPEIRLHDLRHSSASLMLLEGIPLQDVSKRLGHSGVGITSDTYAHVYDQQRQAAGSAMDKVLRN